MKELIEKSSLQLWQAYCDKKMEAEALQEQVKQLSEALKEADRFMRDCERKHDIGYLGYPISGVVSGALKLIKSGE